MATPFKFVPPIFSDRIDLVPNKATKEFVTDSYPLINDLGIIKTHYVMVENLTYNEANEYAKLLSKTFLELWHSKQVRKAING